MAVAKGVSAEEAAEVNDLRKWKPVGKAVDHAAA